MNIHEYQAKQILKKFKVPVSEGVLVEGSKDGETFKSKDQIATETKAAVESLKAKVNPSVFVVKAQIHAGGRGKAGGVKVCKTADAAAQAAQEIMGKVLVTPQTGAALTFKKNITWVWCSIARYLAWS
jgi:succinyl-CoA synthetase beta subunit